MFTIEQPFMEVDCDISVTEDITYKANRTENVRRQETGVIALLYAF